jgi:hypothetical protein
VQFLSLGKKKVDFLKSNFGQLEKAAQETLGLQMILKPTVIFTIFLGMVVLAIVLLQDMTVSLGQVN